MTRVVWKFGLCEPPYAIDVRMPRGARVVAVGRQAGRMQLWAVCDPDAEEETRRFVVFGTGQAGVPPDAVYLGVVFDGIYVWHVFEVSR
jgi:hypothetical protein